MTGQDAPHIAYARGKNAVWNGGKIGSPYASGSAADKNFWDGVRDARAEKRLDDDREWDDE